MGYGVNGANNFDIVYQKMKKIILLYWKNGEINNEQLI